MSLKHLRKPSSKLEVKRWGISVLGVNIYNLAPYLEYYDEYR